MLPAASRSASKASAAAHCAPKVGACGQEPAETCIERICHQLEALREVPQQLHTILDSVSQLQLRLGEVCLPHEDAAGAPAGGSPAGGSPAAGPTAARPGGGGGHCARPRSPVLSSAMRAAMTRPAAKAHEDGDAFALQQSFSGSSISSCDDCDEGHSTINRDQSVHSVRSAPSNLMPSSLACPAPAPTKRHVRIKLGRPTQRKQAAVHPAADVPLTDPDATSTHPHVLPWQRRPSTYALASLKCQLAEGFDSVVVQRQRRPSIRSCFDNLTPDGPPHGLGGRKRSVIGIPVDLIKSLGADAVSVKSDSAKSDCESVSQESETSGGSQSTVQEVRVGWTLSTWNLDGSGLIRRRGLSMDGITPGGVARLPRLILLPNGYARLTWDAVIVFLTVFIGAFIPIKLAYFQIGAIADGAMGRVLCAVDAFWVVDILCNFCTAPVDRRLLVASRSGIAISYLKRCFLIDLLAAWPFVLVPEVDAALWAYGLMKLLRLVHLGSLLSKLQKECRCAKLMFLRVFFLIALLSHIMSCAWRVSQRMDGSTAFSSSEWWREYIADTYWLQMTMTTVGYGDIYPQGTHSRIFAILAMLIAPIFFGSVVSVLSHITKGILNDEVEKQVGEAMRFMRRRGVPADLQRRVDHNLRHHIKQENRIMNSTNLLAKLSPAVQRELSLELLSRSMLTFPLFQDAPHAFIADIAHAHVWVQTLPGDLVVEEGQLVQELVFVIHGLLVVQPGDGGGGQPPGRTPDTGGDQLEYEAGAWFGEECLFQQNCIRKFNSCAAVESELAVLAVQEFHRVLQQYPPQSVRHKAIEHAIQSKRLNVTEIGYRPPTQAHAPSRKSWVNFFQRALDTDQ